MSKFVGFLVCGCPHVQCTRNQGVEVGKSREKMAGDYIGCEDVGLRNETCLSIVSLQVT